MSFGVGLWCVWRVRALVFKEFGVAACVLWLLALVAYSGFGCVVLRNWFAFWVGWWLVMYAFVVVSISGCLVVSDCPVGCWFVFLVWVFVLCRVAVFWFGLCVLLLL